MPLRDSPVGGSAPFSSIIEAFSITHGVNLLLVNAVARRRAGLDPAGDARWTFTARFGAGASIPHPESTIGGRPSEGYEWGALSVQAAAGVEARVTRVLSLIGEYKLTHVEANLDGVIVEYLEFRTAALFRTNDVGRESQPPACLRW